MKSHLSFLVRKKENIHSKFNISYSAESAAHSMSQRRTPKVAVKSGDAEAMILVESRENHLRRKTGHEARTINFFENALNGESKFQTIYLSPRERVLEMAVAARPSRLCQSCRSDLLSLFESGFCKQQTLAKRPFLLQPRTRLRGQPQSRDFISLRPLRKDEHVWDSNTIEATSHEDEALAEGDRVEQELAALERLEKELGKPLDEAIREDQLSSDRVAKRQAIFEEQSDTETFVEGAENPIALLRATGATTEDIVREARTVFGESLPDSVLNEDEGKIYRRLYGEPVEEDPHEEAVDLVEDEYKENERDHQLYGPDGEELQHFNGGDSFENTINDQIEMADALKKRAGVELPDDATFPSRSDDQAAARAIEIAESVGGELYESDEYNFDPIEDEESGPDDRAHPLTTLGKFSTSPRTVFLNQETFVKPLDEILGEFSNKQLREMCEKTFGGPGLPDSPLTPRSGVGRKQVAIPLNPSQHTMGEMEANAYFSTVVPPTYAAITATLVETRKRLGSSWLRDMLSKPDGPRILDAGAGGAGILAWRDIVDAEWRSLHHLSHDMPPPPQSKAVVLTGSDAMRHRSSQLLENTTFVPRLPDYVHVRSVPTLDDDRPAQSRKEFDIIIAPHTLFPFKEEWQRKQQVQNLWSLLSPDGGILILIEKGVQRGFEAIAGARDLLLNRHISSPGSETYEAELNASLSQEEQIIEKETGMIVAPCTNHTKCPMYTVPGLARGRKDFCSFQQRYIRPGFLQRILGATDRNHDEVDFSYVAVMKGKDLRGAQPASLADVKDPWTLREQDNENASSASEAEIEFPLTTSLPRIVYPSLKRRGHVTLDLCTPQGNIERWTVPKSFDKQAYRDARKSRWGDLWALSAKTKRTRNLQLGSQSSKEQRVKEKMADEADERRERREEEALKDFESQEMGTSSRSRKPKAGFHVRALAKAAKQEEHDDREGFDVDLEDWEQEFAMDRKKARGKKGGAFAGKSSSSSQSAKQYQKMGDRIDIDQLWSQGRQGGSRKHSGRDA